MLWRMISWDYTNWKKALVNKYFQQDHLKGVELPIGAIMDPLSGNYFRGVVFDPKSTYMDSRKW
jgi:hypothetical protein